MARIRLTEQADLGVIWDAERARYPAEVFARLGVSREKLMHFFADCPTIGYEIDGVAVGGAIFHDNQLHMAVLPDYFGRWALLWPATLQWVFSYKDPIELHIEKFNERCLQFFYRNGCRHISEDENMVILELSSQTSHVIKRYRARLARRA